jgi:hypothetical protein
MNVNLGNVTTSLRNVWDELLERRLWPLALALVVAIVAIPVVLSKPSKQPPAPPPAPAATGSASPGAAFQPAVSTEGKKSSEIRKNLRQFNHKNPFTPQGLSAVASSGSAGTAQPVVGAATAGTTAATGTGTAGGPSSSNSATVQGGSTGSTGTPSPGTSTKKFFYTYTVDVKFGKSGQTDAKTLTEFRPLPSSKDPVVVFMGVRPDGKTAVFLVSASATTTGDGKCSPSDTECTFLYMKKNDVQTIESVSSDGAITDYTLKLKDINVRRTTDPQKASAASDKQSNTRFRLVVNSFQTFGF